MTEVSLSSGMLMKALSLIRSMTVVGTNFEFLSSGFCSTFRAKLSFLRVDERSSDSFIGCDDLFFFSG